MNNQTNNAPFSLDNNDAYAYWRDEKLKSHPNNIADLLVEVKNPQKLSKNEYQKCCDLIKTANMAIYIGNNTIDANPDIPKAVAKQFSLGKINKNWLADDSGLTSLTKVSSDDTRRKNYIPFTDKAINWHTDGYYNPLNKQIYALNLHVVQKSESGGENQLMDHEIAYILLREKNPDYIQAMMQNDAMTIPAGIDMFGKPRPDSVGPVFSTTEDGFLHMRYTARKRNIHWAENETLTAARSYLGEITNDPDSNFIFKGLLEPGMGLISNNILHDRAAFTDSQTHKRHYYRARYFERIQCA